MLFHNARAGQISAATSGLMLLHLCLSVPEALMQRAFQFKQRMVIQPAAKIAFAGVSILFAVLGYGAWSMVVGSYASIVVPAGAELVDGEMAPVPRTLLGPVVAPDGGLLPSRWSWSTWPTASATRSSRCCSGVGWDGGSGPVPVRLPDGGDAPAMAIVEIFGYLLFPAFAGLSADSARFRDAFLRALGWTWFAVLPLGAILVVASQPVAVLLLGDEWRPAGTAAMAMSGMTVGAALHALGATVMKVRAGRRW